MKHSIATITKANRKKETSHINVFWSVGVTDVLYIRITPLSSVLGRYIQERFLYLKIFYPQNRYRMKSFALLLINISSTVMSN